MKKIIIVSTIITSVLSIVLIAIYNLEAALTALLIPIVIGMIALTIGTICNGIFQIKAEVNRRKRKSKTKVLD